jgi:hypothetical protein
MKQGNCISGEIIKFSNNEIKNCILKFFMVDIYISGEIMKTNINKIKDFICKI